MPGLLHVGYVLGGNASEVLVAYTTSQPWPDTVPLPAGARQFDRTEAAALNQRPFVLRLDLLAKLPLTKTWFPELEGAAGGVVAMAPKELQERLIIDLDALMRRRRELIEFRGL